MSEKYLDCAFITWSDSHMQAFIYVRSRFDHSNDVYEGKTLSGIAQMQSIFNAAARLIGCIPKFAHIIICAASCGRKLHRLQMHKCLCVIALRAVGPTPSHLASSES